MFKQHPPAPLPADGVAAAMAPFGQSRMLPREAYVDPAVFDWEQQHIFSGWTCVGHASDLAAVGAQKAVGSGRRTRSCWSAATTTRFARSPTPAATAGTNCWRATRPPRVEASCARTTRGRIGWTAGCAMRRGFTNVDGFDADQFGLAELQAGELARLAVRRPQRRGRRLRRARRRLGRRSSRRTGRRI